MQVLFNQVALTLDPVEVVNAQEAREGRRAELNIAAIEPEGGARHAVASITARCIWCLISWRLEFSGEARRG